MRWIIIVLSFPFGWQFLFSQNSFTIECQVGDNLNEVSIIPSGLGQDENAHSFLVAARNGLNVPSLSDEQFEAILLSIDEIGNPTQGIAIDAELNGNATLVTDYDIQGSVHAFQLRATTVSNDTVVGYLFVIDLINQIYWCRETNKRELYLTPLCLVEDGIYFYQNDIIPVSASYPHFLGINRASTSNGSIFWSKEYYPLSIPFNNIRVYSMDANSNGIVTLSGVGVVNSDGVAFILQVDSTGTVYKSIGLTLESQYRPFGMALDNEDNIIVWGQCLGDENEGSGFIIKLDPNLNVIWGKILSVDFVDYWELEIDVFPNNDLLFSYNGYGDIPVVIGRISEDGEMLLKRGFALFTPSTFIQDDYSVLMASSSKTLPDGTKEPGLVIVKADSLGNVAGCPSFDACVELIDFEVETFPLEWTVEDTDPLPMYEVEVEEFDFSTSPYCVTPPPPTPTFTFPDTLCAGAYASPDSMNNRLAHQAQWYVQGPGLDTLIADTTFALCFIEPGEYLIEQEVWLLGCSEIEQHTLTVLPPLQTSFNRTDTICGALPVSLSVQADRVLRDWNWSTGATIPSLPIAQSGTYAVTVSDGYCADTLSAELTLVAELAEEAVVQLPPEQTICATELPYLLQPFSPYTTNFTLLNNGEEGTVFALTEPGTYTVQADYLGCPFTSTFRLQTSACANTLYWPNVFSPNADGINDRWAPQSPEHDLTLLQIFDRWGGLVYESRAADAYWDGRGRDGQPATAGVYVGLVRYRHRVSGEEGMEQGEVLLMR
jgi:gliding motility-associated-like protein